jgi:UDP-glucose 4-epimerase
MSLRDRSVLVTGGAGFIGSHLVDRIARERPGNLVVVDNFFLGTERNLEEARARFPGLKVHRADAGDLGTLHQIASSEKIEIIFDLAVFPLPTSLEFPSSTFRTNVAIALSCCELARMGVIRTLVHCSSSEAYGSAHYIPMDESHPLDAMTPYAASKAAADQLVLSYHRTFGIDMVIARPFNNFGPRQNAKSYAGIIPIVINKVRRGEPVEIYGDGLQTRDYVYALDTVECLVRLHDCKASRGKIVNVASAREVSVNDLVARLLRILGAPDHPVVHVAPRPGDVRRHCGKVDLLRSLTGYAPQGVSDDALRATVAWYREAS